MEPSEQQYQPIRDVSEPKAGKSRKRLVVIIGIAVVVLIIAAILFAVFGKDKKSTGKNAVDRSDTSLYYGRQGYDPSSYSADIGDPNAIKLTPKKDKQTLTSGLVIIPACSIITTDDLAAAGFKLYPNAYGYPVSQNYLSGSGKARFAPDPNNFPLASDTVSCSYGLMSSKKLQSVTIAANQPFSVTDQAATNYLSLRSFQPQTDINGYKVLKKEASSTTGAVEYVLRKGGNNIKLDLILDDQNKAMSLLQIATKNLNDLNSSPRSISEVSYDSPTFKQKYARACDLIDNDDVKQLSGVDASPLVQEHWPTAVGVVDFSKVSNYKTKTNYLRSQCTMVGNDPAYAAALVGTKHHALQVTTTTYENQQAAVNGLLYYSVGEGNDTKTNGGNFGQESYLYKKDGQSMLAFRQGRVVVEVTYNYASQTAAEEDLGSYGQMLAPVGTKMANLLKDYK